MYAGTPPAGDRVLLPGLSVYRLPDEIRLAVMPRVLLDHVAQIQRRLGEDPSGQVRLAS